MEETEEILLPQNLLDLCLCKQEALQFPTRASLPIYECKLRLSPQSCLDYGLYISRRVQRIK
jgi:hypothetical protein